MGRVKITFRIKTNKGRGSDDADAVFGALGDQWDDFSAQIKAFDSEQNEELKALVDHIAEDADPTPFEMLSGSKANFEQGVL